MKRNIVAISMMIGLLVVILVACGEGTGEGTGDEPPQGQQQPPGQTGGTPASGAVAPTPIPTVDIADVFGQGSNGDTPLVELSGGVSGIGEVEAARDADLVFSVDGTIEEVYVEEGDEVREDQMLAILDVRRLDHQVTRAEAALVIAKANQSALFEEPREADVAAAEAQVRQAEAALMLAQAQKSALFEAPRAADIEAANAQIRQAEASLAYLTSMPDEIDVRAARAALDLANVNLQATRDQLSHAKTQAEFQVKQAAYQLTQAQWNYALAQRYWEHAEDEGTDPLRPETINAMTGQASDNELSGGQEAQYRTQYEQAKAAMEQAEEAVQLAIIASEGARKSEVTGVQAGEQRVVQAQISLEQVLDQPNEHQVAQSRAGLDLAIANRSRLNPDPTGAQIAQTDAGIAQAQAGLDLAIANRQRLNPDPQESQQLRAEAQIIDADSALELARLNREYAELRAPFDGTIAEINIDPGDPAMTVRDAAIKIVDVSDLYVSVDISDVDISKVSLDQPASVYADALPGQLFTGRVSYIAPTAKIEGNIRTYEVKITLDEMTGLKPGMSTRVEIDTEE